MKIRRIAAALFLGGICLAQTLSAQNAFAPSELKILYSGATSFDTQSIGDDIANLIDQSVATSLAQPGYTVLGPEAISTSASSVPPEDADSQEISSSVPKEASSENPSSISQQGPNPATSRAIVQNPLFAQARNAGAQALVSLQYFRDGNRITLIVRLYDTWSGRFINGGSRNGTVDLSLLNVIDLLLSDVLDSLASEGPAIVAEFGQNEPGLLSRGLLISGPDEDARVSLQGAGALGVIHNGVLQLDYRPLAIHQTVSFMVEKDGFYPARLDLLVGATTPEPVLPKLYPMGRLGFMFNWDPITLSSFGLSVKFYPLPDSFYVEAGYTFVSASMRQNLGRDPDEVQIPFNFNHRIDLQTGVYLFFPPESLFRFRIAAGAGFAVFPGPQNDPELLRNLIVSLPVAAIDLNLRPFTASLSFGAEFAVDIGGRMVYPPGLIRAFQPFRLSLGILL